MDEPTQLRMGKSDLDNVPVIPVPEGYVFRSFRPGDEVALARIYNVCNLGLSTPEAVEKEMLRHPCFRPERIFIAENGDEAVATAAAWYEKREPYYGYTHMLGVMPEHRHKRLGTLLTVLTIRYTRDEGLTEQHITTDGYRNAAIHLYLNLGYYPLFTDDTHPGRWDELAQKLKRPEVLEKAKVYQWPSRLEWETSRILRKLGIKKP